MLRKGCEYLSGASVNHDSVAMPASRRKKSIHGKSQFKFEFELENLKHLIVHYHT